MKKKKVGIAIGVIIFGLTICISIMIIKNPGKYYHGYMLPSVIKKRKQKMCKFCMSWTCSSYPLLSSNQSGAARIIYKNKQKSKDIDLPTFDFSVLAKATENFSSNNKLGEGGFGPVYKVK